MAECAACSEETSMPFRCKFCSKQFCGVHRLPENHDCGGLENYQRKQSEERKRGKKREITYEPQGVKRGPSPQDVQSQVKSLAKGLILDRLKSATYGLLFITTAISIIAFIWQDLFFSLFALHPAISGLLAQPWTIVSALFIHGSVSHLFVNMLALFFFGPELEHRTGTKKFLEIYFVAGILASLGYVVISNLLHTGSQLVPAVGASGAILGVFAAVAIIAPHIRVFLFFIPIPIKIRTALIGFAILNLFLLGGRAGIAASAHLVGILVGVWYGKRLEEKIQPAVAGAFRT